MTSNLRRPNPGAVSKAPITTRGGRLVVDSSFGGFDARALMSGLQVRRIGRRVVCLDGTGSTNDDAFALAAGAGLGVDGSVVFAERQVAGRGRLGHKWVSPRGAGIQCSALMCGVLPGSIAHVSLAAGVAACRAISRATELTPSVRWPNDVFIRGRKVGGVLVERRDLPGASAAMVIGIGINCLQQRGHFDESLAGRATSLDIESSCAVDRLAVARALLEALDEWIGGQSLDVPRIVESCRELSDDLGTRVTVISAGHHHVGRILDIDPDAALLLQTDTGMPMTLEAATTSIVERHA